MIEAKISKTGIPYLRFGKGEPFVLIHGLGEIKEGWIHQFELSQYFELIIPDLRGHGECNKTEGITIQNFAADIILLLNELNIKNTHILGLSMGGAVAQEIYRQSPSICRSLILASSFHYFPKKFKKWLFENRKAKFEALSSTGKQTEYLARMALYSWNDETVSNFNQLFRPKQDIFINSLKSCLEVNNLSLLRKIKIPTLIIGGQYDSVLPVWIQACMHKQIPHSKFVIIRNTGHLAKLEAKDHFNLLLRSFLGQQAVAG
ncbi:alpha/beta fold hydrolase [Neobacillus muris]|uniref:alpha/beta fold hydrolase n=1 Tax=Neobacillus muris TaxID=2941334 RepID=UPI00203E8FE6|nr:alpha/beta hydrolase [Neobacillus muris]